MLLLMKLARLGMQIWQLGGQLRGRQGGADMGGPDLATGGGAEGLHGHGV